MSIITVTIYITIFVVVLLLTRGIVIRIWAFFTPLTDYIELTYIDKDGKRHVTKLRVDDTDFIDTLKKIKASSRQKQGSH